jgi:hypothetical protein
MSSPSELTIDSESERFCPDCGYNLRGMTSDRCPECGILIGNVSAFTIPWAHRAEIGRVRAFGRSVWLATFHPTRLARAVHGPVDPDSANRFRSIVISIAWIMTAIVLGSLYWQQRGADFLNLIDAAAISATPVDWDWELKTMWSAGAIMIPVLPIGLGLMFFLWGRAGQHWFKVASLTPTQRSRSILISRYALAPLAWIALSAIFLGGAWVLEATRVSDIFRELWLVVIGISTLFFAMAIFGTWWSTLSVLRQATHCTPSRWVAAAVGLPLSWLLAAGIALGILPCLVGLIWIAIDSLR